MIKLVIQQGPFEIEYNYQEADPGQLYGSFDKSWKPTDPEVQIIRATWIPSKTDLKDHFGDDIPPELMKGGIEVPKDTLDSWLAVDHNEENFITEALDHGEDIENQEDPRDP